MSQLATLVPKPLHWEFSLRSFAAAAVLRHKVVITIPFCFKDLLLGPPCGQWAVKTMVVLPGCF